MPPSTATPGERPQRGGILRLAVARGSEAGFDPSLHSDWYIHLLLQPVYDGLLQLDPRSAGREVMPGIAESWQMTDDGRAWLFRIRSGVRFHNGDPVDAETVRFNIDRAINPLSGAVSIVRTFLTPIKDIAVVDARTVRITTSEPWAAALTRLAHPSLRIVSPRLANRPPERLVIGTPPPSPTPGGLPTPTPIPIGVDDVLVGTGPFKLAAYDRLSVGRLDRNDAYWDRGKPYLDEILLRILPDQNTVIAAFTTGALDLYLEPAPLDVLDQIRRFRPAVTIWRFQDQIVGPQVHINTQKPSFSDVRVRQALRMALDDAALADLNANQGPTLFNSPMGTTAWGLSQQQLFLRLENRSDRETRLAQARQLLADAGFPMQDPITIMVGQGKALYGETKGPDAQGQVVARSLRDLGLNAQVVERAYPSQFVNALLLQRFDIAMLALPFEGYPDPDGLFDLWAGSGVRNYSGLRDSAIDNLLASQAQAIDPGQRLSLVLQAQRAILDSYAAFYLPLSAPSDDSPAEALMQPWVKGFTYDYIGARFDSIRFADVWIDPSLKR